MKKLLVSTFFLSAASFAFSQGIVNGGSEQGLISLVPEKAYFGYQSEFKYIKPEGALGFWRLRIVPERISTALQSLTVEFEFKVDEPTQVRGPNVDGGEVMYKVSDFQTTIRGSLEYIIEGNYTDPVTGKKFTFENKKSTDRFGDTIIKGELFTWGPEIQNAIAKYKINADPDPAEAFLAQFKVQITRIEAISRNYSGFEVIDKEVGRRIEEGRKKIKLNNILADARNAEAFKRYDEAIAKYQEALALSNDPAIRAKIDELKALVATQTSAESPQPSDQQANDGIPADNPTHNASGTRTVNNQTQQPNYGTQSAAATSGSMTSATQGTSRNATSGAYGSGSIATAQNAQSAYDPEAWAKFNQSQQSVKKWQQDFERSIVQGEQDRRAKQQYYDQVVSNAMAPLADLVNQIEAREQQKKINRRQKDIEKALDGAFAPLYEDIDYWTQFQKRLSAFADQYQENIPTPGLEALGNAIKSIQHSLDNLFQQEKSWREEEREDWDRVAAENDIFDFPLGAWRRRGHKAAPPAIGYDLTHLVNAATFVRADKKISYVNDAAALLSEFAADRHQHEIILSAADQFSASGGTLRRFIDLTASARAIAAYIRLKDQVQKEYNAFEAELQSRKGLLVIGNSHAHIQLQDIHPLVSGAQSSQDAAKESARRAETRQMISKIATLGNTSDAKKRGHSMGDLFPRINELSDAYASLKSQMGEFAPAYARYNPERTTDLTADGYFVEPGEVTLTLWMNYMEPSPLEVKVPVLAGERKTIDIAAYHSQFTLMKQFRPFEVDLKKERFKMTKSLLPAKRNRGGLSNHKFNLAYTAYNMGISEISTTFIGSKSYRTMASYNRSKIAFFTNVEGLKVSYGLGKITTGYQHTTGAQYYHDILDFNYLGVDGGVGGLGLAIGLFKGRSILELQPAMTLINYRFFSVDATEKRKLSNLEQVASGNYKVGVGNWLTGHARVALNTHIGNTFLNIEYSRNFYPFTSEIDRSIGDDGDDISQLSDDYKETHTDFFLNISKSYFTNSMTVYLLF